MTTLTIRNVDPALKERLRVRAACHGRSMEAELRHILKDTLGEEKGREVNLAEAIRRPLAVSKDSSRTRRCLSTILQYSIRDYPRHQRHFRTDAA
jgi:antitoxin FitA